MKKIVSLLCVFALLAGVVASCGSSTASEPAPASSGSETTTPVEPPAQVNDAIEEGATLVYWPMWAETEPQGLIISQAIDAFTAETGVEVEVNWAGGRDTRKTLQPALDAGEVIDVFDEDIERVNATWGAYLLDIQEMYDASALNGKQNATLIDLAKQLGGGTLKSVPYQPSSFLMMYNKDAFDKAGVTAVPTTWDEFLATCEALKTAGIIPLTMDDAYMASFFGYMVDRTVGDTTAEAIAAGDFTNPAVLETAQVIEDLIKKGYIDPRASGNIFPAGQSNIADGSVAMYLDGTWLPNEIKNETPEGFRWGTYALPQAKATGDGPEANQFGAQSFAINKNTQYPNAAFAFIEWMTSGEWDQKLATETLGVPMANDAVWPDALADAKACFDNTTKRLNWAVGMENDSNVNATIKQSLAQMINGSLDAQGFADAFAKIQKAA